MAIPAGVANAHLGTSGASTDSHDDDDGHGNDNLHTPTGHQGILTAGLEPPAPAPAPALTGNGESSRAAASCGLHAGQHHRGDGAAETYSPAGQMDNPRLAHDNAPLQEPRPVDAAASTSSAPVADPQINSHPVPAGLAVGSVEEETHRPGPGPTDAEARDGEPLRTADPDPGACDSALRSSKSKGKQKQKAVHFESPEPDQPALDNLAGPSSAAAATNLKAGDYVWETSPDRPPVKLPIRFLDAVGRTYIFSWEKAKTWEGMKRLIEACFIHVDVIGPHVFAGHFDLIAEAGISLDNPFANPGSSAAGSTSPSRPSASSSKTTPPPAPSPPNKNNDSPSSPSSSSSSSSSSSYLSSTPSEAHRPTPETIPALQKAPIILPELWDDFVVPGMVVRMHMWPMNPLLHNYHPHPQPPPPPPPHLMGHPPPPPPMGMPGRGRGTHITNFNPGHPGARPRGMPMVVPVRPKTKRRPDY